MRTEIFKAAVMSAAVTTQICMPILPTATPSEYRVAASLSMKGQIT